MSGFDFQINPYFLGGNVATRTSVPYPLVAEEEMGSVVEGAYSAQLFALLEEFTTSSAALDGEMHSILRVIYEGPDSLDSITAVALSGEMVGYLFSSIDVGIDAFNGVVAHPLDGTMKRQLIVITIDTDSFNGVNAVALGGTIT